MSKQFPIHPTSQERLPLLPRFVPWEFVAPHEPQAKRNHDQSLQRLAERGGLSWTELLDVVQGQGWTGKTYSNRRDPSLMYDEARAAMIVLAKLTEFQKAAAA